MLVLISEYYPVQGGWMFIYILNDKNISDVGSNIGMFTVAAAAANFK